MAFAVEDRPTRPTTRDPVPLGRAVVFIQILYAAISAIYALATALRVAQGAALDPATPAAAQGELTPGLEASESVMTLSALAYFAVFLVSAIVTLKWIYRVNFNARRLGRGKTISAGWSVGWFFVPVANLVMPFRGLRETWQIAEAPLAWRTAPTPALLRWWWGFWLVSNGLASAGARIEDSAQHLGAVLTGSALTAAAALLGLIAALLLIRIVRRLSAKQREALEQAVFD